MGQNSEPSADEQYCHSCGDIIKNEATICPSCGVSTDLNSSGRSGQSPTGPGGRGQQSYGLIFSIIDSWKYQKAIRHLINIALITVSVGTYLVVLLIEGLIHYRNLNNGNSEPYDESKEKVWTTFTDVQ
jgi:hypothetical protein